MSSSSLKKTVHSINILRIKEMQDPVGIIHVQYRFTLPEGKIEVFDVNMDAETLKMIDQNPEALPAWTRLEFNQCPNCPLDAKDQPHCPLSVRLVKMVKRFSRLLSHDEVDVEVRTKERTILTKTTAQRGLRSLMGLVMAASDCPFTDFFKPMAYFHLPFANEEETIWRVAGTYLLAQYFLNKEGKEADLDLKGLVKIYDDIQRVNSALAKRLCEAIEHDSMVNAIILLDVFAKILEPVISESLERIRYLMIPILEGGKDQNSHKIVHPRVK